MPVWGRRGAYVGATTTVVALVAVGVLVKCGREAIPPPENNDLASFASRFMNRASRQGIEWRTTDQEPFAEAARLGRPVMVFAGTSASQAARRFDDEVFGNREVWARLNRYFVCVRVDLTTEPEWRSAFLPVLRNQVGADPGFTVWFFKPNGQLLTWIGRRAWEDRPDFNDFLGSLSSVQEQFATLASREETQAHSEQRVESLALTQTASRAIPDMETFFGTLASERSFFQWQAARYRALLQAGLSKEAADLLERDLATPRADLLDGGFFRLGSWSDPSRIEFDKSAAMNAEMAAVLARIFVATGRPAMEYWYRRTIECITSQFMSGERWSSYVENAVGEDGRSFRNSFSLADLRTKVGPEGRQMAGPLGLAPASNPLMAPYIADSDVLEKSSGVAAALESLRESVRDTRPEPGLDDTLDAGGIVVARTIEAALVMGDDATLETALGWAYRLRDFRAGTDEVTHSTRGRGLGRKWLGDFAAYAEAMLMAYTATGDESWLEDGHRVLRRALELFRKDGSALVVSVAGKNARLGPVSLDMPSVSDNGAPPAVALLMSVCFRYGAVLDDQALRAFAVDLAERYSSVANGTPTAFASFLCAAQEVMLTGCRVSTSDPTGLPGVLVLRGKNAGHYVGIQRRSEGPLQTGN